MKGLRNRSGRLNFTLYACIIVLLAIPKTITAQFGVQVGTTVSNFYYTHEGTRPSFDFDIDLRSYLGYDIDWVQLGTQKPIITPYVSAYYNFRTSKRIGLSPGLSFTQKGVSFSQFEYERIIYKVIISYIEIPLSVNYQLIQKEHLTSAAYFGAYGSIKINAIKEVGAHHSSIEKININSVKNFDGGIHFGIDMKRKLFNDFFLIDLRIFIGLNNIFEMPDNWTDIYFEDQKTKITGVHLNLGYEF